MMNASIARVTPRFTGESAVRVNVAAWHGECCCDGRGPEVARGAILARANRAVHI
jgi:hypothetical protein